MRQLGLIAFLFLLVGFGTYYLVVEHVNLDLYYGPTPFQFPQQKVINPLPAITPGPAFHSEFSEGPAPTLSPRAVSVRPPFRQGAVDIHVTPQPFAAPTSQAPTPLPAPTYAPVTPPPLMQTPPPIVAPGFSVHAEPTATADDRTKPVDLHTASPTPREPTPGASSSPLASPTP